MTRFIAVVYSRIYINFLYRIYESHTELITTRVHIGKSCRQGRFNNSKHHLIKYQYLSEKLLRRIDKCVNRQKCLCMNLILIEMQLLIHMLRESIHKTFSAFLVLIVFTLKAAKERAQLAETLFVMAQLAAIRLISIRSLIRHSDELAHRNRHERRMTQQMNQQGEKWMICANFHERMKHPCPQYPNRCVLSRMSFESKC